MPKRAVSNGEGVPAKAFLAWQTRHKLSNAAVGRMFGVSVQTIGKWRNDGGPKIAYWACKAYDSGVRPPWLDAAIKPPMRENDGRKKNVPPHLRDTEKPQRYQPRPRAPEWPVDISYED